MTVAKNGRKIPAVTQLTKSGYAFILDRRDGKPIFGVNEVKVPPSDVPGEESWPTQPIPVKPPPLTRTSWTPAEIATVTPEQEKVCRDMLAGDVQYGGPFNPYRYKKLSIVFPGSDGGVNWSGGSYDPSLGYIFVNPIGHGGIGEIVPAPEDTHLKYIRTSPFGGMWDSFTNHENHWPCQQPPWSQLIAINVNTGDIAWKAPLGIVPELEAKGVHNTGAALSWGGAITTAGGLIFIASTSDSMFRAFDEKTGAVLWQATLPASGFATPMTYKGHNGKQYVVIDAAGGRGFSNSDALVAYSLPSK
jgi:quinoprotein glucose dehydrogenase